MAAICKIIPFAFVALASALTAWEQEMSDCHNIVRCLIGKPPLPWNTQAATASIIPAQSWGGYHTDKWGNSMENYYGGTDSATETCLGWYNEAKVFIKDRQWSQKTGHYFIMAEDTDSMGCALVNGRTICKYVGATGLINPPVTCSKGRSQPTCEADRSINKSGLRLPTDIFCGGGGSQGKGSPRLGDGRQSQTGIPREGVNTGVVYKPTLNKPVGGVFKQTPEGDPKEVNTGVVYKPTLNKPAAGVFKQTPEGDPKEDDAGKAVIDEEKYTAEYEAKLLAKYAAKYAEIGNSSLNTTWSILHTLVLLLAA